MKTPPALGLLALAATLIVVPACRGAVGEPEIPIFRESERLDAEVGQALEHAVARARQERSAESLGELGRTYHANEFLDLARRCYEIAAALEPERSDWPYYLGRLAADRGRAEQAIELLRKSTKLAPEFAPAYFHLGNSLLDAGELDSAERAYSRFVKLAPDRAWGFLGLARTARRRGHAAETLEGLRRAAALPPRIREVSYLLATTYAQMGRSEEAEMELQRFRQLPDIAAPRDALMERVSALSTGPYELLRRAKHHEGRGELKRAQELYEKVLAGDAHHYAALANLGNLHKQQRRHGLAEEYLRRAVDTNPAQGYAYALLAGIYLDTKRLAESEAAALAAIERDPEAYNAFYYLGRARAETGRLREAIEPLRRSVELAPQLADAHFALALCYSGLAMEEQAEAELKQVLRLVPSHSAAKARLQQLRGASP